VRFGAVARERHCKRNRKRTAATPAPAVRNAAIGLPPMAVTLSPFALRKDLQCRSFAERKTTIAAPDRENDCHWAAPNGLEVLWNSVTKWVKKREGETPAEPPNAGKGSQRGPESHRSAGASRSRVFTSLFPRFPGPSAPRGRAPKLKHARQKTDANPAIYLLTYRKLTIC